MIDSKEFSITDLIAHTEYEIFATVPNLGGSVSNIRKGMTMDGPPTAPPTDVRVGVINNTAAYVRWSPPPSHLLNGELTGYKVSFFLYFFYVYFLGFLGRRYFLVYFYKQMLVGGRNEKYKSIEFYTSYQLEF